MRISTICCGGILAASLMGTPSYAQEHDDEHHVLDEIIVSATPLERTVEQLAQPTGVVSGDDLTRSEAASIGETIANQPGVTATYFGPVASRPVIRGQYGERVRVLSNSLDALDASALSEDHAVSVDSILARRVEIVRGPATLLYGSGAAGGLVNIVDSRVHERPLETTFDGALALGSASATNLESGAVKFDAGNDRFVFHVDGFRRDTDDVEIPGSAESAILHESEGHEDEEEEEEATGRLENTASETWGGAISASLIGSRGFFGVSVSRHDSDYGVPGEHHHEEDEEEHEDEHEDEHDEEEEELVTIGLEQTRYDLTGKLIMDGPFEHVKARVAFNDYGHTEFEGDEVGTVFDTQGTDARFEFKHRPLGLMEGALGLQYKNIDFKAIGDEAFVPTSDTSQTSVFAFEEFDVNDIWTLQASGRLEHQRIDAENLPRYDDTALGVSLGAIWNLDDALTLSGNFALTERHPNATELYADGPHLAVQRYEIGSTVVGTGILKKEFSSNFDLTLRGSYDRIEFGLTGFVNNVNDYILLSPTGEEEDELPVFVYTQTDADLIGFEAELLVDLIDSDRGHLHARLHSDFVQGEQSDGAYLPRIPPLRYGVGLHFTNGMLDASIDATRYDRQDKTAVNELPTAAYTLLNASVSYRFENPDLLIFVRGTNLGDEDARRHSSPLKDIAPLPGRSIHVGLRWDFGA